MTERETSLPKRVTTDELVQLAKDVRERAYTPYSRFPVGAAVETASGEVFVGCNVENASFGLSMCAERVAIFRAVAAGARDIVALAVVAETATPVSPCGACRQVMVEFNPDLRVILANLHGEIHRTTARELIPGAFSAADLLSGTQAG
jgi:cytidine deaminase